MDKQMIEKEDLIALTDKLTRHGIKVFGSEKHFNQWLNKENFFFDKKPPIEFITTDEGIKFIDDRLTGIEYGDNS